MQVTACVHYGDVFNYRVCMTATITAVKDLESTTANKLLFEIISNKHYNSTNVH